METKTFLKLCNLLDISYEGETEEEQKRWRDNVLNSVGENGYTLEDSGDGYCAVEFSTDEIEFVTVDCYNFMGSEYEQERFYPANWLTVRERDTGDLYAYDTGDLEAF